MKTFDFCYKWQYLDELVLMESKSLKIEKSMIYIQAQERPNEINIIIYCLSNLKRLKFIVTIAEDSIHKECG